MELLINCWINRFTVEMILTRSRSTGWRPLWRGVGDPRVRSRPVVHALELLQLKKKRHKDSERRMHLEMETGKWQRCAAGCVCQGDGGRSSRQLPPSTPSFICLVFLSFLPTKLIQVKDWSFRLWKRFSKVFLTNVIFVSSFRWKKSFASRIYYFSDTST